MKTPEELNALKSEVETLNKKLAELTAEELEQVTGCAWGPDWGEYLMECSACHYSELRTRDPGSGAMNCPKCHSIGTFRKR